LEINLETKFFFMSAIGPKVDPLFKKDKNNVILVLLSIADCFACGDFEAKHSVLNIRKRCSL